MFSSRKEQQQQQQQQQNLSVRARVVYTARSVFVFFVCFLNERQKANEDAFTGPFPYEEGVFEEKNKPTTKTFSSRTTKKREPLLSRRRRRRRARVGVVYYRGQSLGGFLLSSLSSSGI